MNSTEHELMRLLHGELTGEPARRLRERLERDPALAETYHRLRRTWEGLDLPPAAPVPPGFSQRTMARIRAERAGGTGLSWSTAPVWVRATAAAALVAGTALGIGVGGRIPLGEATPAAVQQAETAPAVSSAASATSVGDSGDDQIDLIDDTLANSYWSSLDETAPADQGGTEP